MRGEKVAARPGDGSAGGEAKTWPETAGASNGAARTGLDRTDPGARSAAPVGRRRQPRRSPQRFVPRLAVADCLAVGVAWVVSPTPVSAVVTLFVLMVAVLATAGRYSGLRLNLSVIDDLPWLAAIAVVGCPASTMVSALVGDPTAGSTSGRAAVGQAVALFLLLAAFRATVYSAARRRRRRVTERHRTLILGSGEVGHLLASSLRDHPSYGLEPVGFLDSEPRRARPGRLALPVLGGYDRLIPVIREQGVSRLIVAYGGRGEADLVDGLRTVDRLDVDVAVVPRLYELHSARHGVEEVRGVPLVWIRRHGPRRPSWHFKRAFDVVVSTTALVLLAPVLLTAALAVRLEGGRGVIFRQRRVGLDGREFELLKFRSLRPIDEQESQTTWNISEDGRMGPVGRFLRQTSVDELPQLWNVLRGDMSLVGPRPERQYFVELFSAQFRGYPARHRVPAGLTGWAQVHGLRGDTSIEERARFDNYYIENWSLWLDMKTLVKTVGQVVRRQGG